MHIFGFISWLWNKIPTLAKVTAGTYILIFSSFFLPKPYSNIPYMIFTAVMIYVVGKLVFSILKYQYNEYLKEKQKLFEVIRTSENSR